MPYNNNIPQPQDIIANGQQDFIADFQEIANAFAINHRALNDAQQGKHMFLQMAEMAQAPTTLASEGALYTREGSRSTVTELNFRREDNGTSIAFTEGRNVGVPRWMRFGNGLLVKHFPITIQGFEGAATTVNFNWPVGGQVAPFTVAPFCVLLTKHHYGGFIDRQEFPNISYRRDLSTAEVLHITVTSAQALNQGWEQVSAFVLGIGI